MEPSTRAGKWLARHGSGPFTARQRAGILGVLFVAALALTALTFWKDSTDSAHERDLLDQGSRSTARVEDVFRARRDNFVQLTLLIIDGDAEGWEVRTSLDPSTTLSEGDHLEVAYDSDDPGDLVVVGETAADNNGLAVAAWILFAIVAARFGWSTWKERESEALK